ncbi:MAG: lipopolysaccharide export system permease protein [Glaciecola sp.]|jgi:lipopolysaccharide export system permease protein
MIWFWKWLEDIVGKGIEVGVIAELVGYASLNQVPLSLPLAILLSSIMTYGKLGETVELTAIKSLGISLWRAMFPLILLVTLFSGLAFIFSNNVLPQTNKNLKMLLNDVSRQKPELNIPEGVFYNQLEGYSIRIGKKHPDKTLEDIIIFQNKLDNNRFITAHTGRMELGNDGSLLVLTLYDGNAYDQESEKDKINQDKSYPLVHNQFKENQIIFDLESFQFTRSDDGNYSNNSKMRNVVQLEESIDSMGYQMLKRSRQLYTDLHRNFYFIEDSTLRYDTITPFPLKEKIVLHNFDTVKRKQITHHAADVARNAKNYIHSSSMVLHNQKKIQNRHKVEFHRKFTLSFACILLFFVGAPFGAIVKKGGLGAPVIISVFLFLTFHVLSIVGEKLAKNDTWEAYEGMWMATIVLLPIGILLTYKATSDSAIFNAVAYKKFFLKLIGKGKS